MHARGLRTCSAKPHARQLLPATIRSRTTTAVALSAEPATMATPLGLTDRVMGALWGENPKPQTTRGTGAEASRDLESQLFPFDRSRHIFGGSA